MVGVLPMASMTECIGVGMGEKAGRAIRGGFGQSHNQVTNAGYTLRIPVGVDPPMIVEPMTRADFLQIIDDHDAFWDNDLTYQLHHPIFIEEFGDTAFVFRDEGVVVAYLFALLSQTAPIAYVHMVAVRESHRGRGLARSLYHHFIEVARTRGCTRLKATASAFNEASIRFHLALGMTMQGEPSEEGVEGAKVVKDYLRRDSHRVVFLKDIV